MSNRVGNQSQKYNREYELDNYSIDLIGYMDRLSKHDGLQSVSCNQVRIEPWIQ